MHAQSTPDPAPRDASVTFIPLWGRGGIIRGYTAVDPADAAWAMQWHWSLGRGYARRTVTGPQGRQVFLHRELLGLPRVYDGIQGDHRNRDRLDNRRCNLRAVTPEINGHNRSARRGSSSRYRGVTWNRRLQRWCAMAGVTGSARYLGSYATELDAARAAAQWRAAHMPGTIENPELLSGAPPVRVPQHRWRHVV